MIDLGYVASVNEAFDRYLSGGRPAFVPRDDVTPEWSIELIHSAGGVAVLAHPLTTDDPERNDGPPDPRWSLMGPKSSTAPTIRRSVPTCGTLRFPAVLIQTGGSDFHGAAHREEHAAGEWWCPPCRRRPAPGAIRGVLKT